MLSEYEANVATITQMIDFYIAARLIQQVDLTRLALMRVRNSEAMQALPEDAQKSLGVIQQRAHLWFDRHRTELQMRPQLNLPTREIQDPGRQAKDVERMMELMPKTDNQALRESYFNAISNVLLEESHRRLTELTAIQLESDRQVLEAKLNNRPDSVQLTNNLEDTLKKTIFTSPQSTSPGVAEPEKHTAYKLFAMKQAVGLLRKILTLSDWCTEFNKQQELRIEQLRSQQIAFQARILAVGYWGFAASLLLAVMLVVAYSAYINGRLAKLLKNAESICRPGESLIPLPGKDEFAYVQDVFSSVRWRLNELSEFRGFVVRMVAHDLRTPLMAAQMSLKLAQSEFAVDQAPDQASRFALIKDKLQAPITFVEQLLTIERKGSLISGDAIAAAKSKPPEISANLFSSAIFRKVILITLLPLLVQLGWVLLITHQLELKNSLAHRREKLTSVILSSSTAFELIAHALACRQVYALTGQQTFKERFLKDKELLEEVKAKQEGLPEVVQGGRKGLNEVNELIDQVVHRGLEQPLPQGLPTGKEFDYLLVSTRKIIEKWEPSLYQERHELDELQKERTNFANSVQRMILSVLLVNGIFYLLLLFFFLRDFKFRLNRLTDGASSLLDPEAVPVQIDGKDELSTLGQALNFSKEQLKRGTAERTRIVSEIVEAISLPLAESKSELAKIQADSLSLEKEVSQDLEACATNIDKVNALVADLLTLEQLDSQTLVLEPARFGIENVIKEACDTVRPLAAERGITLNVYSKNCPLTVDKSRIVQVLVNFLSNAIRYSPKNSEVRIFSEESDSEVNICVADQGGGMDAETRGKVFDRFFQGSHASKGFGLGLYISKVLVDLHGGRVFVESELGKGSRFYVVLPK